MNAHDTAIAIARALATSGELALESVHIYAHDTEVLDDGSLQYPVPEILLPGVFVRVQFDGLLGSGTVGKAKVEMDVESQSDDTPVATHSARETAVRKVMADQTALLAAFAASGTVELLGRPALTATDPGVEQRAFKTPINYVMGVRTL